jgi:hypothetical protein
MTLGGAAFVAVAALVGAPIAANAGVDPAAALEAVLPMPGGGPTGGATGGAGVADGHAVAGIRPAGPPRAVGDSSGLRVSVSPTVSSTVSLGGPVAISVEIENATGEALAPAVVRLVRADSDIDDAAELDEWLAVDHGAASDLDQGADTDAANLVPIADGEARGLPAGGATVVSFTVPADTFAELGDSPVIGLGAELLVGDTVVATGTSAYANADVPASGSVAVALAAPITTPTTGGAAGLIDADLLTNWTSPTGLLTRQLDAVAGRRVAIGVDPRIIASIRVLGTTAPPTATAWLQRLAELPNEIFPLAYSDADVAVQAQVGLPSLLEPTSFADAMDPANFPAGGSSIDDGDDDGLDATGSPTTPATGAPVPQPTPGTLPTAEQLLSWPYTRTDLAWPADDTVTTGNLGFLAASGLTTSILSPGNVEPVAGVAPSSATIDGSTALVADAGLTEPLRAASTASTDTEWREATGQALASLALDAGAARTTVFATFDRGSVSQVARVSALIDEIGGSPWSTLAGLSEAIGAPPEARTLIDEPESEERRAQVTRLTEVEAQVSEFSTVLTDPSLLTGPVRRELLSLLDVAWLDDVEAWNGVATEWLVAQRGVLGSISVVPSSTINVVSTETGVPTTVENTLPYPVTVVVDVSPSNGRLIVEEQVEQTVEPQSRSTVRVPVAAGVGNGEVTLTVSLTSTTGVPIGTPVDIPVNVQADWEGLGAAILAAIAVVVFGLGVWRNIRRRRRDRAAAAEGSADAAGGDASGGSDTDPATSDATGTSDATANTAAESEPTTDAQPTSPPAEVAPEARADDPTGSPRG